MKSNERPILTIGIIFKNEIRCLERCLKSISLLRENISCELIMADTGSSDGSHEIAARYADVLFDFPWIDDFSAARNAVMDKASGIWHMYMDADEYLNEDISELVDFLRNHEQYAENLCAVTIRNYESADTENRYSDFTAIRLTRMSLGVHFHGTIHEAWDVAEEELRNVQFLSQTILHHDGYIGLDEEIGKAKRERNLSLLREQLKKNPKDLKILLQYIESAKGTSEYIDIIMRACNEVENKQQYWENLGAPIFRYAVRAALEEGLPEFQKWVARAEKWFPDSLFTKIDVAYMSFLYHMRHGNYAESINNGISYLESINDIRQNNVSRNELAYSTLLLGSSYWEQDVKIYLSDIYAKESYPEQALKLLQSIDGTMLDVQQTETMLLVLGDLHRLSNIDTDSIVCSFLKEIGKPNPSKQTAQNRLSKFYQTAMLAFHPQTRSGEKLVDNYCRPSYTLFLPLADSCEVGLAAAILETNIQETIYQLLLKVKNWDKLPVEAISHALESGTPFPLSEKILKDEEMECLAVRLSENIEDYVSWLIDIMERVLDDRKQNGSLQVLAWSQHLILTAVLAFDWKTDKTGKGIKLARFFSKIEKEYLTHFFNAELLYPENLALLPMFLRFGWYCAKAFDSLDSGDISVYVHMLKAGLEVCPEANAVTEYLIKYTPQLNPRQQEVSEELLILAEQVRKLLSGYPPNHPAIAAIKASDAYQKVAWLVEENQ